MVGTIEPPFRPLTPAEDAAVVDAINAARPDIIWVGLSTPKQERWMASHIGRLEAPVLIGVGAAFDFLAGEKKQAPGWMQRNGLEWLVPAGDRAASAVAPIPVDCPEVHCVGWGAAGALALAQEPTDPAAQLGRCKFGLKVE